MASKVNCFVNVYETNTIAATAHPSTCNIEFRILYRYQLKLPSNEGTLIVIEDFVLPEIRSSFRVPIVSPLSMWSELYLSDVLKRLNLDPYVISFLKPKFTESAVSLANRNGNNGFTMVLELGILKAEHLSKDEVDRIAGQFDNIESSPKICSK